MRSKSAFTLLELLVVITIIAVLASMLLPAIGMVRESARSSVCMNQMRQFGLAFFSYTNDNDGQWSSGTWNQDVQDYLNSGGAIGSISVSAAYKLARCPSVPKRTAANISLDLSYAYTGVYWDTVGNQSWNPNPWQWYFAFKSGLAKRQIYDAAILKRGSKVFLSETWDDTGGSTGQTAWGVNTLADGRPRLVHGKGTNVVCADGRGTHMELPGLTQRFSQNYSGAPIQSDTMWFPLNGSASVYMK